VHVMHCSAITQLGTPSLPLTASEEGGWYAQGKLGGPARGRSRSGGESLLHGWRVRVPNAPAAAAAMQWLRPRITVHMAMPHTQMVTTVACHAPNGRDSTVQRPVSPAHHMGERAERRRRRRRRQVYLDGEYGVPPRADLATLVQVHSRTPRSHLDDADTACVRSTAGRGGCRPAEARC
jgi:hypothetical protein